MGNASAGDWNERSQQLPSEDFLWGPSYEPVWEQIGGILL